MTYTALIETFLSWKEHNQGRAARTTAIYRCHLLDLAEYFLAIGKDPLTASKDELEVFAGIYLHKKGLVPMSRRCAVAAIRGFFKWANDRGHISDNAALYLPYPKTGRKLPVPLSLESAEKLMWAPDLTTFKGIRDAAIMGLLIGCGMRISGLVALNESSLVWVGDDGHETLVVKVIEKGKKERLVPVPAEARLLLRAYLGHEGLDEIDRTLPDGDKVLFVSTRNRTISADKYHGEARRITTWSVRVFIQAYGAALNIPTEFLHPHAMRHLYGKELAEEEVDILSRQALMGHEDPKSTQWYSHISLRKLRAVVDRANPLSKIRTPATELLKKLRRT